MAEPTLSPSNPPSAAGFGGPATASTGTPAPVAAGNGLAWWQEGWRLFTLSPWVWIAITLSFLVILILLHLVPLIGSFASTILTPVLVAGMMAGCNAQDRGGEITINHLFSGFSEKLVPLVILGLVYLAGTVLIVCIVAAIAIATIGMSGIGALMTGDPTGAAFTMLATLGFGAVLAVLVGTLAALPLMMAYWFAPALVMLRNDDPLAAMKASFFGCLANIWPMLVYSLIGIALAIVATIPLALGWIILAPVFAGSVYASYKDIFGAPA
jgi:uncharacterized membrane protein